MATLNIIPPKTAAHPNATFNTSDYEDALVFADGLAGAEEVTIFVLGGKVRIPYTIGTTAQKLTATSPMLVLQPGVTYQFDKPATAATCGVYMAVGYRR